MTLIDAIRGRRSIRAYKNAPVTKEQVDSLLEAAMLAPSANNGRPWEFIVVQNRQTLDTIAATHPYAKMLKQAPAAIILCGNPDPQDYMAAFFPQDCAAATQNILLRAVDMGLGTCWCGVYPVEKRMQELRDILGITSTPFNIIALGVPNESPAPRGTFDPAKVTYR
jgi:nitroreductase